MKRTVFLAALVSLGVWGGCKKSETPTTPSTNAPSSSGNPLTAPVDYLGSVAKAQQSATKTTSTLGIKQAIDMFKIQEGRNPTNLQELVSEDYLPRLPDAPAGMKFSYDPASGQVSAVPAK